MSIVGVVSGLTKTGLTYQLVQGLLEGAESAGADTRIIRLVEYDFKGFPHSRTERCTKLDEELRDVTGLALASPVYWKDMSGLMKNFIDYMQSCPHLGRLNGRPGVGISIAGGSGMGQIPALQTLCGFFFFSGMRAIDPIPVSRFNFQRALVDARASGERLAELAEPPQPFETMEERVRHFHGLQYLDYDIVDELLMLDQQMLDSSSQEESVVEACRVEHEKAVGLARQGKKTEAIKHATEVYQQLLKKLW